jgi:hypothetical protein
MISIWLANAGMRESFANRRQLQGSPRTKGPPRRYSLIGRRLVGVQFVQQAAFTTQQADVRGQQTVGMSGATQAGIVSPHDCRHTVEQTCCTLLPIIRLLWPVAIIRFAHVIAPFSLLCSDVSAFPTNHRAHAECYHAYRQQTGLEPTVAAAVRITGPNRARMRDYLTSGATYSGLGGAVSFDKAAILKANTFYKSPPILPFG